MDILEQHKNIEKSGMAKVDELINKAESALKDVPEGPQKQMLRDVITRSKNRDVNMSDVENIKNMMNAG